MDGSSLASWDTAEQSVVTWSEVMMEPTMVGSPCLERLPLALPQPQTKQGIQVLLPTTPTNNPPLCAFPPLDQLNTKVCPTNIVHICRQRCSERVCYTMPGCTMHNALHIKDNLQGYWTPPEEECDIPTLPSFDPKLLANAPPELLRGSRQSMVRI